MKKKKMNQTNKQNNLKHVQKDIKKASAQYRKKSARTMPMTPLQGNTETKWK